MFSLLALGVRPASAKAAGCNPKNVHNFYTVGEVLR
jgi:hypothetical protein